MVKSLCVGLLVVILLIIGACTKINKSERALPNIIFIRLEDDINSQGEEKLRIPALTDLAKQSLIFDNAYSHPIDSVSLKILFTGKISGSNDMNKSVGYYSTKETNEIVDAYIDGFVNAGYNILFLGKWDYRFSYLGKNVLDTIESGKRKISKAIDFIEKNNSPTFININYKASDFDYSDTKNSLDFAKQVNKAIIDLKSSLDRKNKRSNTVIVITTNNKFYQKWMGDTFKEPYHPYDNGLRVYTLINWPGNINARRISYPISEADFLPTFMTLAGMSVPGKKNTGLSLTKLFTQNCNSFNRKILMYNCDD